jgi:hypothetical protein
MRGRHQHFGLAIVPTDPAAGGYRIFDNAGVAVRGQLLVA